MRDNIQTDRGDEIISKSIPVLLKYTQPDKIYLFGSRAKGKNKFYSDIDLGIDAQKPSVNILRKIDDDLEEFAGLYSIDLIFLKSIDPDFKDLVETTGKLIYEK